MYSERPYHGLFGFFPSASAQPVTQVALPREFKAGDRVRCPSGMALGEDWSDEARGVGTVGYTDTAGDVYVDWHDTGENLYHKPHELELVSVEEPSTVTATGEPEGIVAARLVAEAGGTLDDTPAADFIYAMFQNREVFDKAVSEGSSIAHAAREVFDGTYLSTSELRRALREYDRIVGREPADVLAARQEVARLEAEVERLDSELDAAERHLDDLLAALND